MIVDQALDRARAGADASGVPLASGDIPPTLLLRCDRRQVVSAVTNLVDNAVKYSEAGARVQVTAAAVPGDLIEIAVSDEGIGIPSRDLERIFERFYRVDRARSRATGGTGLGLSIVRHVAQAHGGEVVVESTEGVGSTFRLRIPAQTGSAAGLIEEPPSLRGTSIG